MLTKGRVLGITQGESDGVARVGSFLFTSQSLYPVLLRDGLLLMCNNSRRYGMEVIDATGSKPGSKQVA